MTYFKGRRTLDELKEYLDSRGWPLYTNRYDDGCDWVTFDFDTEGAKGSCVVSMVNGQFMGEVVDGPFFMSQSDEHDGEAWFQDLLRTVYVDEMTESEWRAASAGTEGGSHE